MNKRTVAIIDDLAKSSQKVSIAVLAEKYDVSQRTIRNDINAINEVLSENEIGFILLESGGVLVKPDRFDEILPMVGMGDFYSYKLSRDERKMIASAMLVNSVGYVTLSTIADNLMVSRATIINDLDETKKLIKDANLEVISHPNKGLRVEGKESDKRWFLFQLSAFQHENADMVFSQNGNKQAAMTSVQAGDKITIQKIINEQEHIHQNFLTDDSFLKLQRYLGIMISRNLQGEYIEKQEKLSNSKYLIAQDILKYISQYCQIKTTEDEVQYLSLLLKNSHYMKHKPSDQDAVKTQMITRQFIREVSEDLGINLNNDYDFFENLSNHLDSMFHSSAAHFPLNNTLEEIAEDNPTVVAAVKNQLHILNQSMDREITASEVLYIVIHICAAMERKKNREVAFHVIVACHAGIGTSQLLMERLKKHFNFQIVDIISAHEASNIEASKADFIISTVPLQNCKLDYVVVTPLLNDEDYIRVGNKIDALRNSRNLPSRIEEKEVSAKGLIEKITPLIYDAVPDEAPELMRRLRREIRSYFNQSQEAEEEIFAPALHHLLSPRHIQLDVECSDWKDAIRRSAEVLLKKGYIEERYVDAMIANIEENGPYIVVSPGFAVPHEGLDKGSIKVGMNLIRLKTPVPFGAEELDPVEFVCCLSAVDHKTHLKAFFHLVNMLGNETFHQELHEAKTEAEMASIIERYEYSIEE